MKNTPNRNACILTAIGLTAALLVGCAGVHTAVRPPDVTGDPFFEEWDMSSAEGVEKAANEMLAEGDQPVFPAKTDGQPARRTEDILSTQEEIVIRSEGERSLPTNLVQALDLAGATDVEVVLRTLGKIGNESIMISPTAAGTVDFSFKDIPWDQAFEGVLASAGLTYRWEGDIIRVMTLEDMKRDLELEKVMHERKSLEAQIRAVEPLVLRVVRIKYLNAKKVATMLQQVVSGKTVGQEVTGRLSVTVDEDNNCLVVHAIRKEADKMSELIARLDRPKALVRIDAEIVEANSITARELGIQWGGNYSGTDNGRMFATTPGVGRDFNANFPATFHGEEIGFTLGLLEQSFGHGQLLQVQLSALEEDGKLKILSSPTITTLDNEPATIETGEERAYRETSATGNDLDVSIAWKKAVLKLEVTPHVIDAETLKIQILANKDSFDETRPESNGELPVNTKNAKTTVILRNGQSTVIGGLQQRTRNTTESGVPFLKNIPLLGRLFKGTSEGSSMDEILIFITPYILDPGAAE
ncbi:MAG: type IV pilus secretin PilQ [Lentisphaerales bacterium]|nr:MAG: type IV pilus secretin PilQ [Lentisphaerales bacterium]